jgi:hypothetical protein
MMAAKVDNEDPERARVVFQICTFTGMYAMLNRSLERGTLWYSFLYDVPIVRAIT